MPFTACFIAHIKRTPFIMFYKEISLCRNVLLNRNSKERTSGEWQPFSPVAKFPSVHSFRPFRNILGSGTPRWYHDPREFWPWSLSRFQNFYVLLPYIIYVMPSGRFSHCSAFLSQTAWAGQKIAAAVQKVKSPVLFIPLFWNQRNKLSTIILFVLVIKLTKEKRRRVWRGRY